MAFWGSLVKKLEGLLDGELNPRDSSGLVRFQGWIQVWLDWTTGIPSQCVFDGPAIVWWRDGSGGARIVAFFDMRGRERVWDDLLWKPLKRGTAPGGAEIPARRS